MFLCFAGLQKLQQKCFCVLQDCKSLSGFVFAFCKAAKPLAEMFLRFAALQ
jgi:hypothetical protein